MVVFLRNYGGVHFSGTVTVSSTWLPARSNDVTGGIAGGRWNHLRGFPFETYREAYWLTFPTSGTFVWWAVS